MSKNLLKVLSISALAFSTFVTTAQAAPTYFIADGEAYSMLDVADDANYRQAFSNSSRDGFYIYDDNGKVINNLDFVDSGQSYNTYITQDGVDRSQYIDRVQVVNSISNGEHNFGPDLSLSDDKAAVQAINAATNSTGVQQAIEQHKNALYLDDNLWSLYNQLSSTNKAAIAQFVLDNRNQNGFAENDMQKVSDLIQAKIQVPSTISSPGVYGPETGTVTVDNVVINSPGVTLRNTIVTGNLTLGEGIAEGDATLDGVEVRGTTMVRGGGEHSIHFNDSVLVTVIVNKNNGAVRIVAEGDTDVFEVQLETPAVVYEDLDENVAEGFRNVTLPESLQLTDGQEVVLEGSFDTVNSRAARVRVNLSGGQTDIRSLVLNAAASIVGDGVIHEARINADGSTISSRPQNIVLAVNTSVVVGEGEDAEVIDENQSGALQTSVGSIDASMASTSVDLQDFVAGLTIFDFDVTATMNGEPYDLQGLQYDDVYNRITYYPIEVNENTVGNTVEITVTPSESSNKLVGEAVTDNFVVSTGFEGRITDIQGNGVSGVTINFRALDDTPREGEVVGSAVTDEFGYYSVSLPAGTYVGEFRGEEAGYLTTYNLIATALSDYFNTNQNDTAIRAAGSEEVKIMLTWGEDPRDLDSHLTGPTPDGGDFHTWYSDKTYEYNGITYVDLDWDDVESFGPETTTIRHLVDGKYIFYVHKYSGQGTLRTSDAHVEVYRGNSLTPDNTFTVPAGEGNERYWIVFGMSVSDNGNEVEVMPVNEMQGYVNLDVVSLRVDLRMAIAEAQLLHDQAVEGVEVGNYPDGSKDRLQEAINSAEETLVDLENDGASALINLQEAVRIFEESIITEETPAVDEETPAVDEEIPAVDEETPAVDEETPAVDEEIPVVDEETPVVDEETPVVDEETPVVDEETPAVDEETPVVDEETPVVDEETPVVDEETPAVDEETPAVDEEMSDENSEEELAQQALEAIQEAQETDNWDNITVDTFNVAGVVGVTEDNFAAVTELLSSFDPGVGIYDGAEISANIAQM